MRPSHASRKIERTGSSPFLVGDAVNSLPEQVLPTQSSTGSSPKKARMSEANPKGETRTSAQPPPLVRIDRRPSASTVRRWKASVLPIAVDSEKDLPKISRVVKTIEATTRETVFLMD